MDVSNPVARGSSRAGGRWFYTCLALLMVAFTAVVWNRHEIRAQWWAMQLASSDETVREQAGLSLAFMTHPAGAQRLIETALHCEPRRAEAAVASMAHLESHDSMDALCHAARSHSEACVRAQAVESIMIRIINDTQAPGRQPEQDQPNGPIQTLVDCLSDEGRFSGLLSFERQVASAARFAGVQPTTAPASRTVGEIAANSLAQMDTKRSSGG